MQGMSLWRPAHLPDDVLSGVDGDSKGYARRHEGGGVRDADHLAVQVDNGSARVALVDGCIHLNILAAIWHQAKLRRLHACVISVHVQSGRQAAPDMV